MLRHLAIVDLTVEIRRRAGAYGALGLRGLDAIHIATAAELTDSLGTAITVVTYDRQMLAACENLALPALAPA